MLPVAEILGLGFKLIDKLIPDPQAKAQAQLELMKLNQEGEFRELEERMGAIKAEAASSDPWTSRARPSFMYVMYTLLLAAIPFGFFFMIDPINAKLMVDGLKYWFQALPEELYLLFGAGYLGYAHYRSADKKLDKK